MGQHKHIFDEKTGKRGGYVPSPNLSSELKQAVLDFLEEENITFRGSYVPSLVTKPLDMYDGV